MSALAPGGKPGEPVHCGDCGHEFPQDPCYEVECPDCGAKVGQCCIRPSEHQGPFVNFHAARDLLAAKMGFYAHVCKAPKKTQSAALTELPLFAQMEEDYVT